MAQNIIDNSTQTIIKRYTILYKAIFQYSIYFIPFILGIIWAWTLQSSNVIARTQIAKDTKFPSFATENGIYRAARISDEVGPIFNGFGNVKILGGELQATGNMIIGRNNLIALGGTNGGIILPNRPYVINLAFTGGLEYFTNKDYSTAQLKRVMDNWILSLAPTGNESSTGSTNGVDSMFFRSKEKNNQAPTNMEQVLKILQDRMFFEQYEKGGGILEDSTTPMSEVGKFIKDNNLTCLFGLKFIDIFCDVNVNKFIKSLPEVTLDNARFDVLDISRKITKPDQVDAFCSNLMINILRKPYPTAELDKIMGGTCKEYDNRYEKLKVFLGVQNEIESIVSENLIGTDTDFNIFKLVSIQQKMYSQHKDKLLDTALVTSYLRFLSNLINDKSIILPQFYIEESYYYNNVYLKNMLKKLTIETVNPTVNDDVSKLLDTISNLNKGNQSIGIVGLDNLIINSELKKTISNASGSMFLSIQNFEQVFTDIINTYPELRATSLQTDETARTARFVGILQNTKDESYTDPIPVIIDFSYKDGKFLVSSMRAPQNETTDSVIQGYMKKNNNSVSLGTLIYLVQSNADFNNPDLGICNIIIGLTSVLNCEKDNAVIQLGSETITFSIYNNIVLSGIGSNPKRQQLINSLINNNNINQDRIMAVISTLESTIMDENTNDGLVEGTIDPEQISVIEKCKKFLGVTPKEVVKSNNKWLVSFTLQAIDFAGIIDVNNNYKLSPLVINVGGKNITIAKFSLSLINIQEKKISKFIADPLLFIKEIDINKYNQIIELQKGTNGDE